MSNSVIYIVVASGGQYEDSWERNLIATFDKTLAEKYIADEHVRKEIWKKHGTKFHEMVQGWSDSYEKKNPIPEWKNKDSNELVSVWAQAKEPFYREYEKRIAESFGLDLGLDYYQCEDAVFMRIEDVAML